MSGMQKGQNKRLTLTLPLRQKCLLEAALRHLGFTDSEAQKILNLLSPKIRSAGAIGSALCKVQKMRTHKLMLESPPSPLTTAQQKLSGSSFSVGVGTGNGKRNRVSTRVKEKAHAAHQQNLLTWQLGNGGGDGSLLQSSTAVSHVPITEPDPSSRTKREIPILTPDHPHYAWLSRYTMCGH